MTDLANLFVPPASTPPFAQGVLMSFNALTGANTVNVQGQTFTNLPLLNVPDVVNMTVGSVVMLAQLGGSYAIMGRVVIPGSAILNTSAISTGQKQFGLTNFAVTTATQALTAQILAPPWANQVTMIMAGQVAAKNTTASSDYLHMHMSASTGAQSFAGAETYVQTGAGLYGTAEDVATIVLTCLGGDVISASTNINTQIANWTADAGNEVECDMVCIFQRV